MVKSKNKKKNAGKNSGRKKPDSVAVKRAVQRIQPGLDEGARRFARLLRDPCGADLTTPVYQGTDSGYIARYRYTGQVLGAANTDFAFQILPNYLTSTNGSGVLRYIDAGTAGAIGSWAPSSYFAGFNTLSARHRTVACCARVFYTGAESSRSGRIGGAVIQNPVVQSTGGSAAASSFMNNVQSVTRTDPLFHEVLFVPAADDMTWTSTDIGVNIDSTSYGGGMLLVGTGLPADNKTILEITWVVEWQPDPGTGGAVMPVQQPPSNNTYEQVLRSMGPPIEWAINVGSQMLPGAVGMAAKAMNSWGTTNRKMTGPAPYSRITYTD